MLSFRELIFSFPEDLRNRMLEFIFLKSSKVTSLIEYNQEKENWIDFSCNLNKKLREKLENLDYPLTRLTNKVFFYRKKWTLNQGVFSPRIESELLVELVKQWVKELKLSSFTYLDLCSGSGVIFLSVLENLKKEIKKGVAIDSSFKACKNIFQNLSSSFKSFSINIYLTDWVNFLNSNSKWEVITMNPPYLSEKEFNNSKVLCQGDPQWSLQAKKDGWSHYEKILEFVKNNSYWKLIVLECSEFHEELWNQENFTEYSLEIYKYRDYLDKFRAVALIKK
ncbi:N5-glutamine methyltransferase family protein [Mycoplasma parvum]|uniref:Methyltransferase small domain-containing protein n=1 Tax=Mycoplasma parvum str. Indiana TaxID=1403316 RepID=U5NDE9_9MOLU|nr:class I SAM-dependent methyltransferase [Mycoplasma parvum]AGX89330.1 hypothetical protein PRV_03025 [Mycoplasma parvum str. Indiana]